MGEMRERLRILQKSTTADSHGGRVVSWSTLDTVYAELMPLRATERLQAQMIQAGIDSRFRIRVRSDVTAKMRVEWRPSWLSQTTPRTLEIHGIIPDAKEPSAFLLLDCGELES